MRADILTIIDKLGMDETFINYVEKREFKVNALDPFDDVLLDFGRQLSDQGNLDLALRDLLSLWKKYQALGISETIFLDTLSDLKFRIQRFYKMHHSYGLSDHDMKWLGYIYRMETFQIHNLKFRKYPLTYEEIERSGYDHLTLDEKTKEVFYEGLPVIYVHIGDQTDFSEASVSESFRLATAFFEQHFKDYDFEYYVCRTWLLYPGLRMFMNEESNIIKFLDRFEIIGTHNDPRQSLNRIYNTTVLEEIEVMPKTTSLMRSAYLNVDKLGVGVGVIKKEEI